MTQWWLAFWRRGAKKARARWVRPRLELLEQRNLLTQGLVVVPNPVVSGGTLFGAAALATNDIWAVGNRTGGIEGQKAEPSLHLTPAATFLFRIA
jgi:hypothetical protein